MAATATQSVIDIRKVCMAFAKPSGESLPVLADIDIRGNSRRSRPLALLRIAGGLINRTRGRWAAKG
jgi:hypothetical protein